MYHAAASARVIKLPLVWANTYSNSAAGSALHISFFTMITPYMALNGKKGWASCVQVAQQRRCVLQRKLIPMLMSDPEDTVLVTRPFSMWSRA
jgi:hypothetical protein